MTAEPSRPPLSITSGYKVPCTRNLASLMPPVYRSKMRTKVSPITLRFCSGSMTPCSLSKNSSAASTCTNSMPRLRLKVSTTWSLSFLRMSPVSTYTHVRLAPIARCTSAAATAESTPPDNAQIARSSPTWARTAAICESAIDDIVQFGAMPARSCKKWRKSCCPCSVCTTSG